MSRLIHFLDFKTKQQNALMVSLKLLFLWQKIPYCFPNKNFQFFTVVARMWRMRSMANLCVWPFLAWVKPFPVNILSLCSHSTEWTTLFQSLIFPHSFEAYGEATMRSVFNYLDKAILKGSLFKVPYVAINFYRTSTIQVQPYMSVRIYSSIVKFPSLDSILLHNCLKRRFIWIIDRGISTWGGCHKNWSELR